MSLFLFLLQVFIISLSGVLAPGPVTAATIAAGTKSRHAGISISIGHSSIELPLIAAIMLGLGFVFENHVAKLIIGLAGGAFLIWMGWQMFKDYLAPAPVAGEQSRDSWSEAEILRKGNGAVNQNNNNNFKTHLMTGVILSATNPYFLLWWATVGLNLAKDAVGFGYIAVILFALVHSLCDMGWLEILSFTSYKGTKFLNEKNQKVVLALCAAAIMFFGFYFIYKSLLTL
ncbi:MAG: LysE family transporter [Phycisphaerae bacterium]|jgi:threonine/homoserine/homoserine lactone efflux protein